jgi:metal-responsive CopG/Arc/MetJ family transcriptional regulator
VHVRLGDDLEPAVDAYAAKHCLTRAEAVRQLISKGLGEDKV